MLRGRSKRKADFILYYSNQVATFKPFKAVRPTSDKAHLVASRPYDVLNSSEAKIEAAGNEFSFLRVIKPEIELSEGINPYDNVCLLYTSPSPRDATLSRMPSSA